MDALAQAADGVFALDEAERVVFWNAAAERITGYRVALGCTASAR